MGKEEGRGRACFGWPNKSAEESGSKDFGTAIREIIRIKLWKTKVTVEYVSNTNFQTVTLKITNKKLTIKN